MKGSSHSKGIQTKSPRDSTPTFLGEDQLLHQSSIKKNYLLEIESTKQFVFRAIH